MRLYDYSLSTNLGHHNSDVMPMHNHNHASIFITRNKTSRFHERTKHIEIDCHFIQDKVLRRIVSTPFVSSPDQLVDIFTKSIISVSYNFLGSKLDMFDL